ncbi:hypothetical protein JVT61DRAFT_3355 [Boletus reticuloceps]|uniref:Uncharacterized protein n=1 Tax=Boletus reticuloceps TaxID=495285 RepID=A0A8I3A997_9AGAM|nr:hypothetical protein JVT61DRAFT_3612 [Boletus reticuloceps]KAG6375148.1 hypothetical protein JVT61DRAFT_3355 [Boletus reticuloceps]
MGRFSQYDEDEYRLPEGLQRIAYDADDQCYTFRDRSGRLYQSAPGARYGVLNPVSAPLPHRRSVTITEIPDPALRRWSSEKPAKTFGDILPSGYITPAQSGIDVQSPTRMFSSEKWVQAAIPKVQGVVDIVRRRTTMKRFGRGVRRSESLMEEKGRLLDEDDAWDVVHKEEVMEDRAPTRGIMRAKSEMRPSRYYSRK